MDIKNLRRLYDTQIEISDEYRKEIKSQQQQMQQMQDRRQQLNREMTKEQQEAQRIIVLYGELIGKHDRVNIKTPNVKNGYHTAKQCAILHVQGIIDNYKEDFQVAKELHPHAEGLVVGNLVLWNKVKEILEKK